MEVSSLAFVAVGAHPGNLHTRTHQARVDLIGGPWGLAYEHGVTLPFGLQAVFCTHLPRWAVIRHSKVLPVKRYQDAPRSR